MIENIKQIVNEYQTLIVVVIGALLIYFFYWFLSCKDRPLTNIFGGSGWSKLRLSMYIYEYNDKNFIKVGKVENDNKTKELCEALSHAKEISGLFNNYYAYVDVAYRVGNPEDDFHKTVIAMMVELLGLENFDQLAFGSGTNNLNAENYTITYTAYNDLKYYAMIFDLLFESLDSGGNFRNVLANTLNGTDSPDLTSLVNLPNSGNLPNPYFISPVHRLTDLSGLMSGTVLCGKKLWEITDNIPRDQQIRPGFRLLDPEGVEEFIRANKENPNFLRLIERNVNKVLKEKPEGSPIAFLKYVYDYVEGGGDGDIVGLHISPDDKHPQVLINRVKLIAATRKEGRFFDELLQNPNFLPNRTILTNGWKRYDINLLMLRNAPELHDSFREEIDANIERNLDSSSNSQTYVKPFVEKWRVMISNLDYHINSEWLTAVLSNTFGIAQGDIKVDIIMGENGKSSGTAFVYAKSKELLDDIVKRINEITISNRVLKASMENENVRGNVWSRFKQFFNKNKDRDE